MTTPRTTAQTAAQPKVTPNRPVTPVTPVTPVKRKAPVTPAPRRTAAAAERHTGTAAPSGGGKAS